MLPRGQSERVSLRVASIGYVSPAMKSNTHIAGPLPHVAIPGGASAPATPLEEAADTTAAITVITIVTEMEKHLCQTEKESSG